MGRIGGNPEYPTKFYSPDSGYESRLTSTRQIIRSNNPILFLGGLSEIGRELTAKIVLANYEVMPSTRSLPKLEEFQQEISTRGQGCLRGFVIDLTDPEQVKESYRTLDLGYGKPVDLYLWSVGAMSRPLVSSILRYTVSAYSEKIGKKLEKYDLTVDEATAGIKAIVHAPGALDSLLKVNDGMFELVHILEQNGNLTEDSEISTLSSSGSDTYNSSDPDSYPGPELYYPIAKPKQELVEKLQDEAQKAGFRYLNFVAPEVQGTAIVALFNKLRSKLMERFPDARFHMPTITKADLVETLYNQLMYSERGQQIENRYIKGLNDVSSTRPIEWNVKYPF